MVGAERLEAIKISRGDFYNDRRSFVILRVAAGADISKSYKTSVRSEVALMSEAFFRHKAYEARRTPDPLGVKVKAIF